LAGEQTFGKGIIQTLQEVREGRGGVTVTIAKYETPNHNNINKIGIKVDVTLSAAECQSPATLGSAEQCVASFLGND
jgi:carboxyl-terminal processing protease